MTGYAGYTPGLPDLPDSAWRERAACLDQDPAIFFPVREEGSATIDAQARGICGRCDVNRECALTALLTRERYGTWGGMTRAQREALSPDRRTALIRALRRDLAHTHHCTGATP